MLSSYSTLWMPRTWRARLAESFPTLKSEKSSLLTVESGYDRMIFRSIQPLCGKQLSGPLRRSHAFLASRDAELASARATSSSHAFSCCDVVLDRSD